MQTPKSHGPLGNSEINEFIVSLTIRGLSLEFSNNAFDCVRQLLKYLSQAAALSGCPSQHDLLSNKNAFQ